METDVNAIEKEIAAKIAFSRSRSSLADFGEKLAFCKSWSQAPVLSDIARRAVGEIDRLEERAEAKAIVAVVGGTGLGKSTLVSALVGQDDVARSGHERPTTRRANAVFKSTVDGQILLEHLPRESIEVHAVPTTLIPSAVIVDTPDLDSTSSPEYTAVVDQVLEWADVLVCVFEAENAKSRDVLVALENYVSRFPKKQILFVLNRCDRVSEDALDTIVGHFKEHVKKAWGKIGLERAEDAENVFCVSARAALRDPAWSDDESPLHGRNDLPRLRRYLQDFSGGNQISGRAERADLIEACTRKALCEEIGKTDWAVIEKKLEDFQRALCEKIVGNAVRYVSKDDHTAKDLFYGKVTEAWWGPIGLCLWIGRRFRNPFSAVVHPIRSVQTIFSPKKSEEASSERVADAFGSLRVENILPLLEHDPDVKWSRMAAELVDEYGMRQSLEQPENAFDLTPLTRRMRDAWRRTTRECARKHVAALSHPVLQALANAPVLVCAGFIVYQLVWTFWHGSYLPREFYPQALCLLLLLWLIPFWLLQCAMKRAVRKFPGEMVAQFMATGATGQMLPVLDEVKTLGELSRRNG